MKINSQGRKKYFFLLAVIFYYFIVKREIFMDDWNLMIYGNRYSLLILFVIHPLTRTTKLRTLFEITSNPSLDYVNLRVAMPEFLTQLRLDFSPKSSRGSQGRAERTGGLGEEHGI